MTKSIRELSAETLVEKNVRLRQERSCRHECIAMSSVTVGGATFHSNVCLDCGKNIREAWGCLR